MALYSVLNLKSSVCSTDPDAHIVASKDSRFGYPLAWLALFNTADIEANHFSLVAPISSALETINQRNANLSLALGSRWDEGISDFVDWLKLPEAMYVELDMRDWYGDKNANQFEGHFVSLLDTFDAPLYKGKSLFTRAPKISKEWSELIEPFTEKSGNGIFT